MTSHDGPMTLTLRSPAFKPETPIPARFDHKRGDLSPALIRNGVPEGTAGLVLLVDDPDAPVAGGFVHWVLCNLDPTRQGIAEGEPAEATAGANGFGRPGYLGPAPPPGNGPHRYVFRPARPGRAGLGEGAAQLPGRRNGRDRAHPWRSAANRDVPAIVPIGSAQNAEISDHHGRNCRAWTAVPDRRSGEQVRW